MNLGPKMERYGPSYLAGFKPDYSTSITSLTNSILRVLGFKTRLSPLPPDIHHYLEGSDRVVFIVIDGLGSTVLESSRLFKSLARDGFYARISSVFPTTTSTAMTSLATGLNPISHGLLGFTTIYVKAGGVVGLLKLQRQMNARGLGEKPIELSDILDVGSVYDYIAREDEKPVLVIRRNLADTPLTRAFYSNARVLGFVEIEDGFITLRRLVSSGYRGRLVTMYVESYDSVAHVYGPESEEAVTQLDRVLLMVKEYLLEEAARNGFRVVITADHGMTWIGLRQLAIMEDPRIKEHLMLPPYGDMRCVMLNPIREKKEELLQALEDVGANNWFCVLDKKRVLEDGLLGSGEPSTKTLLRLGDLVLIPGPGSAFDIRVDGGADNKLLGGHSGLQAEELLVPLLVF